jgi:hypothetical protein
MKKLAISGLALIAAMALSSSTTKADAPLRSTGGPVTLFVRGPGGSAITPASPLSTLLWDARFGKPALAPDGHQLTLGEWTKVQPRATAKCDADGTHVNIHVSGLIPKGVYTVWTLVFNGPFGAGGPPPQKPVPFGNLVGVGALGANDGSQNSFQASASGEGEINVVMPPGVFSSGGPPFLNSHYNLEGCLLDEVEFHFVGVYHFDGKTYGPEPGFQNGGAEQFGVMFKP